MHSINYTEELYEYYFTNFINSGDIPTNQVYRLLYYGGKGATSMVGLQALQLQTLFNILAIDCILSDTLACFCVFIYRSGRYHICWNECFGNVVRPKK